MASTVNLRRAARKQRKSYREPDTDSDPGLDVSTPPPTRRQPARSSHRSDRAYVEQATEEELSPSSGSGDEETVDRAPPVKRHGQHSSPSRRKTRSSQTSHELPFRSSKRQKTSHHFRVPDATTSKPNSIAGADMAKPLRSGRIPPWQTLPYHVLLSVMQYAAYPLYTGASKDTGSMRWLLNTSELCTSFHNACIGALMYSPPLFPAHRANHLVDLLRASHHHFSESPGEVPTGVTRSQQLHRPLLDYRTKVKALSIEVKNALVRKSGIELSELLQFTPLLKRLTLYHNHDSLADKYLWATPGSDRSKVKWSYESSNLFGLLSQNNLQLEAFEWNGRFMQDDPSLQSFRRQVACPALRRLKSLSLRNFLLRHAEKLSEHVAGDQISTPKWVDDEKALQLAAWRSLIQQAFASFSDLTELTLHTCNVFDDKMMESLPANLSRLSLINIPFIKSEGLAKYLASAGGMLTGLTLHGNQSLCLGFLSTLADTTPHLRHLDVDLTYHDPTSYHDTEPLFDDLLPTGAPSWPSTLESISIGPLRSLSTPDAEAFFQSLIDASPRLPHLRILELRTFLKAASWRDRASLRSKWGALLNETFNVKSNPEVIPPAHEVHAKGKEKEGRKSSRLSQVQEPSAVEQTQYGTGRCHTVVFELSDQRPAAEQFKEADFLDSEPDDDAEWNGRDDAVEPPRYASRRYAW